MNALHLPEPEDRADAHNAWVRADPIPIEAVEAIDTGLDASVLVCLGQAVQLVASRATAIVQRRSPA